MNETKETEQIEGVEFKAYCHLFKRTPPAFLSLFANCGMPRSEQTEHGISKPIGEYGKEKYCAYCGLEHCPRCRKG